MKLNPKSGPLKAPNELTRLHLPKNRWDSFWDCVNNQPGRLSICGLIVFVFALPLIVVISITNAVIFDFNYQVEIGQLSTIEGAQKIFDTLNTSNLLAIPALMILFIGFSGIVRIIRRLIWQEDVNIPFDFKKGVKENAGAFLISGLLLGIVNWSSQYLIRLGYFIANSKWYDIVLPISIAALVLIALLSVFILIQTDIYQLSYWAKAKNAFLLAMRTAPSSLLMLLLVTAPWSVLFISMNEVLYLILWAVFLVAVVPLEWLAVSEYCFFVFDRFINKEHHPKIYDKGIFRACQK